MSRQMKKKEINRYLLKINKLAKKCMLLEETTKNYKEYAEEVRGRVIEKSKEIDELKIKVSFLESYNEKRSQKIDKMRNSINDRDKCVSDLNNSIKLLLEEIEELKKENQSLREENYNLKNRGIFKRLLNA